MPSMARVDPFSSPSRCVSARNEALFHDSSPDFGPVKFESNKLRPIGDIMQPIIPQTSLGFRERSRRLKSADDEKHLLIDELILQLESSQRQLQQLQLDRDQESRGHNENETAAQQELAAIGKLLDRNSYFTVLIDGDALAFSKDFLSKGEEGGIEAVRCLADAVTSYARTSLPSFPKVHLQIRLFVNVKRLSDILLRLKVIQTSATCEDFLAGLLNAEISCDVVDTSLARATTSRRLMESYRRDFINIHCRQIFLAAPANETYNALLDEIEDISLEDRVTVLEASGVYANDKFQHELGRLRVDDVLAKFPTEGTRSTPATKIAAPVLARIDSNSSTKTSNSGQNSATSTPVLTWAAMTAQPFVPKAGENRSETSTPAPEKTFSIVPTKATVRTVPRNKHGQRVDYVDASIPYQELQRIKKMKLCNIYYLQGKNACGGDCGHSHTYPLKPHEKNILKEVARMTPCYYRTECEDPACIYGHRCPQNKSEKDGCYYKETCRFVGWGHGIDEKVVKTHNIK